MKKTVSFLFLCLMIITLISPCFASEFKNPPIVDNVGYLSEEQLAELSEKLDKVRYKYGFEVAVYTESEMTS